MGKTIRSTHATITRDTPAEAVLGLSFRSGRVGPAAVTVGDDLTLAFGDIVPDTIPSRILAIDALLAGVLTLRRTLEREGEARFEELADHHDAAHDADCTCLAGHGVTYLVPIVGERVPEAEAADGPELTAQDGVPRVRCETCRDLDTSDLQERFAGPCPTCGGQRWVMDLSGPGFEDCVTAVPA